jgi:hypothetical protein
MKKLHNEVRLTTLMSCPGCKHKAPVSMIVGLREEFYQCPKCNTLHNAKLGDCCVYCSYGDVECPAIQDISHRMRDTCFN